MAYTSFKDLTFSKKIEHIWFYYKWYILAGLFLLVVAAISIHYIVITPSYDATVLWARHGNVSAQTIEDMRTQLEKHCPDTNGDGEVHVDVRFIGLAESVLTAPVSDSDTSGEASSEYVNNQLELSYKMKLVAEMTSGDSYIFIFDDMVYRTLSELKGYRDLSEFGERAIDSNRISIADTKIGANDKFGDMYMFFCSSNANKAKNQKRYDTAFEVFKQIVG